MNDVIYQEIEKNKKLYDFFTKLYKCYIELCDQLNLELEEKAEAINVEQKELDELFESKKEELDKLGVKTSFDAWYCHFDNYILHEEDIEFFNEYLQVNQSSNAEIKILSPVEKNYEKWKEAQKDLFDIAQTYLDDMEKFSKNNFWNKAKYNAAYKDFKKFEYLYDEKERYENQINYINSLTYQQIKLLVEVYEAFNKTKGFNKESEDKIRELKDNHARIKENCAANIIFKAKSEGIISAFELERVYYELFKIIVLDKFGKISYDDKTTSVNLEQGDTIDAFFYDKSLKELIDSFLKLDAIKNLEDLYLSKLEELNPKEIKK